MKQKISKKEWDDIMWGLSNLLKNLQGVLCFPINWTLDTPRISFSIKICKQGDQYKK